jgi:transposase
VQDGGNAKPCNVLATCAGANECTARGSSRPAIRETIEKARATLRYLPKYSPDLNPIEMPYSKFKTFLRKVAARSVPGLTRAIRSFIPQLGPHECANYFSHAGYASI